MRILVIGAGGFIGRHAVATLAAAGHEVLAGVRPGYAGPAVPSIVGTVPCDLALDQRAEDWAGRLDSIDMVVNCAGLLKGRAMRAVHVTGPAALYEACAAAGVKRVVLISAISARPDVETDYARAKLEGERILAESGLEHVILRPSLVYGRGSYGGTSLMRGLAALPFAIPVPGRGDFPFTPIHVEDVARSILQACEETGLSGRTLEPCGPETLNLRAILTRYRAWMGLGPAPIVSIPWGLMRLLGVIGDRMGAGPVASNSLKQLAAGNAGNGPAFAKAIGFEPRSLDDALAADPAQVQDRWHAGLFFLVPAVKWTLVLLWIGSAIAGLATGHGAAAAFLQAAGVPVDGLIGPLVYGTALLDLMIAGWIAVAHDPAGPVRAQLAVVMGYSLALSAVQPGLWLEAYGPLLKNLPILALIAVYGVIGRAR